MPPDSSQALWLAVCRSPGPKAGREPMLRQSARQLREHWRASSEWRAHAHSRRHLQYAADISPPSRGKPSGFRAGHTAQTSETTRRARSDVAPMRPCLQEAIANDEAILPRTVLNTTPSRGGQIREPFTMNSRALGTVAGNASRPGDRCANSLLGRYPVDLDATGPSEPTVYLARYSSQDAAAGSCLGPGNHAVKSSNDPRGRLVGGLVSG